MAHHCHATQCTVPVPPEMFMCRKHWFTLPGPMRRDIWLHYRQGQCDDYKPSKEYCEAAKKAVVWLAKREGLEPDTRVYDMFLGSTA